MPSVSSSVSVASIEKWGIPGPESSVLERLVWVRYGQLWWPAVLYQSYMELQEQMYPQFSSYVVKAQFALAIMRQMQEKRNVQVARLLGRSALEIVEVEDGDYHDFYWSVADLLPEACDKANYAGRMDLFLDVHRALDEVEEIFRDVTNDGIELFPKGQGTWLERAHAKLNKTVTELPAQQRSDASVNSLRRFRDSMKTAEGTIDWSPIQKGRSHTTSLPYNNHNLPNPTTPGRGEPRKTSPAPLATVQEEPTSSGGNTRYIRKPTMSQEKRNENRTGTDILNSTIQIGVKEPLATMGRTDRSEVPTDELAHIRRNKLPRSSARFSSDELLKARRDKLLRLKSMGVPSEDVQHDKAHFRKGSFSTPTHATCPPVVSIPARPRKSMESISKGTMTEDRSEKREENPSLRHGSFEVHFQSGRDPPTTDAPAVPSHPMPHPSAAQPAPPSAAEEVIDTQPVVNTDLPHQESTDTLLRERYTPIRDVGKASTGSGPLESSGDHAEGANQDAPIDSGTESSIRTPSSDPRKPPLGTKSSSDTSNESKGRRTNKVRLPIPLVQKVGTGLSRADTEKAGNLSDYLPSSPSIPNAAASSSSPSSGRGQSRRQAPSTSTTTAAPSSSNRRSQRGRTTRSGQPHGGPDRVMPLSNNNNNNRHHGGPSLLMEAHHRSSSHDLSRSSLQLAEREPRVDLPFCGFRMSHQ